MENDGQFYLLLAKLLAEISRYRNMLRRNRCTGPSLLECSQRIAHPSSFACFLVSGLPCSNETGADDLNLLRVHAWFQSNRQVTAFVPVSQTFVNLLHVKFFLCLFCFWVYCCETAELSFCVESSSLVLTSNQVI